MAAIAGAVSMQPEEAALVAELRTGSEEAFAWLVAQYQQPVYSLVYRILNDPSDAADTTQEVFLKVFRGIQRFNGQSSLKTWIYRISVHEASNHRRWWSRHKRQEASMESPIGGDEGSLLTLEDTLVDGAYTPFDACMHEEIRARVEAELRQVQEPYRTAVVLRDIEGLAYEEIAEVLEISLGTVKSRLMRGREALRKRLAPFVEKAGAELGLETSREDGAGRASRSRKKEAETKR
ncbi:MAG: sigma-70 family RNA polymerase sigma factor [Acidobacteriales bacterium]|nr:sigma-70 family RNA polymerase sigma factor [Terriglobales bacterium]